MRLTVSNDLYIKWRSYIYFVTLHKIIWKRLEKGKRKEIHIKLKVNFEYSLLYMYFYQMSCRYLHLLIYFIEDNPDISIYPLKATIFPKQLYRKKTMNTCYSVSNLKINAVCLLILVWYFIIRTCTTSKFRNMSQCQCCNKKP